LEQIIEPISGAVSITNVETVKDAKDIPELQGLGGKRVEGPEVLRFQRSSNGMKAPLKALFLGILVIGWLTAIASAQIVGESPALEHVLAEMDAAAKNFKSTEASVVWDQYQKVIDETETEKGRIYFRREGDEIQMAADFVEPDKKYVVYSGGKVQVYQPKIDQVNEYNPGKNRSDVESFLVIGFGGRGNDLFKSYGVKLWRRNRGRHCNQQTGTDSQVRPFAQQHRAHLALD
jgi:outer membrane lipoprotein-sorting protein